MITIVKRGRRSEALYAGTCELCGTEVTYHERDIEAEEPDRPGVAPARYIGCPVCGERIYHTGARAKVQP